MAVYDGLPEPPKQPLAPAQTVSLSGCGEAATITFQWRTAAAGAETGILAVVVEGPQGTTVHTVAYFAAENCTCRLRLFDRIQCGDAAGQRIRERTT